ncbi:MAG: McrB family protein [Gammaproteobacteria bacterium]
MTDKTTKQNIQLLRQFNQIVLYGPPGTGKTYTAKEIVAGLLDAPFSELQKDGLCDIVQFHPSYNYEDFVRGVKVYTQDGNVSYKTENRTFGEMCERAQKDFKNNYALIIDEINRANVSAVLGELIYALEYRGEAVKTPYLGDITIPKNLFIIGTMNTADRTIGQIDYAVRRRFAFVECPPNEGIVKNATAQDFFRRVNAIFGEEHISADFDAADVRIGHSYFMAEGANLANKIIYQVIPILREYVKDGVLQQSAEDIIREIEEQAKKLLAGESQGGDSSADEKTGKLYFYWEKDGRRNFANAYKLAKEIVADFIKRNPSMDYAALSAVFSSIDLSNSNKVIALKSEVGDTVNVYGRKTIILQSGEEILLSQRWGAAVKSGSREQLKAKMAEYGYVIGQCHIVNVGEGRSRSWESCLRYGFVAAGGSKAYKTQMEKLGKNDIVFANCAEETPQERRGCVAYGKVVSEAVEMSKFRTPHGELLAECILDGGEKYRQKYSRAFERDGDEPDYAVGVEWLPPSPLAKPVKLSGITQLARTENIRKNVFNNLCAAFNLNGGDSEE